MHLVTPPKKKTKIACWPLFPLTFSWVLQSSQEKLKTNFWGWTRCIMVYTCENSELWFKLCGMWWVLLYISFPYLSPIPIYCLLFRHSPSFLNFHFSFLAELKEFVPLGCFQDNAGDPAMGKLLKNLRKFIDWRDMSKTVKNCSEIARSHS